jgi:hypothetical protein
MGLAMDDTVGLPSRHAAARHPRPATAVDVDVVAMGTSRVGLRPGNAGPAVAPATML